MPPVACRLLATLVALVTAPVSTSQNPPPVEVENCTCPAPSCGGLTNGQIVLSRYESLGVIETIIDPPQFKVIEGEWWTIDACYSRLFQPPETCPSPCPQATHASDLPGIHVPG